MSMCTQKVITERRGPFTLIPGLSALPRRKDFLSEFVTGVSARMFECNVEEAKRLRHRFHFRFVAWQGMIAMHRTCLKPCRHEQVEFGTIFAHLRANCLVAVPRWCGMARLSASALQIFPASVHPKAKSDVK